MWQTTPLTFNAYFWKKTTADSNATLQTGSTFQLVISAPNKRLDNCGRQQDTQTITKDVSLTILGNPLAVVECTAATVQYKEVDSKFIYEKVYTFKVTAGSATPGLASSTNTVAESILPSTNQIKKALSDYTYLGLLVMSLQGNLTTNDGAPVNGQAAPEGNIVMSRDQFQSMTYAPFFFALPLKNCMVWDQDVAGGTLSIQFLHSGFAGPPAPASGDPAPEPYRYQILLRCPGGQTTVSATAAPAGFHQNSQVQAINSLFTVLQTVDESTGAVNLLTTAQGQVMVNQASTTGGVDYLAARRFGILLDVGSQGVPEGTMRLSIPGGLFHYNPIQSPTVDDTFAIYVLKLNGAAAVPIYASTIPIVGQVLTETQTYSDLTLPTWGGPAC